MAESVDDIFGMLNFLGKKSTLSGICSAIFLWVYSLWHMWCSMYGIMYHPGSTFGDHYALFFGLSLINNLVPGGDIGVPL